MENHRHLPELELEIMLAVWELEDGATAPKIQERLDRPLTASALHTCLKRLEKKGYLSCEKEGKGNRYHPLVSRSEYQREEGASVLAKLYQGSLSRFAAALYDGGALSQADVAELRAYLDSLEEGRK